MRRAIRYIGVEARTVVMSNDSMWRITSRSASSPSCTVNLKPWWTVPIPAAATLAAARSGEPARPIANECRRGHQACPRSPVLDPLPGEPRGAAADDRGVQAARQQHAVGHVGHQVAMHRVGQRRRGSRAGRTRGPDRVVSSHAARVVAHRLAVARGLEVARGELLDVVADLDQRLDLRRHREAAVSSRPM